MLVVTVGHENDGGTKQKKLINENTICEININKIYFHSILID